MIEKDLLWYSALKWRFAKNQIVLVWRRSFFWLIPLCEMQGVRSDTFLHSLHIGYADHVTTIYLLRCPQLKVDLRHFGSSKPHGCRKKRMCISHSRSVTVALVNLNSTDGAISLWHPWQRPCAPPRFENPTQENQPARMWCYFWIL